MDKAAREKARERQPFERFPTLAASIAHLGFRVTGISLQDWNEHLAQINAALAAADSDNAKALRILRLAYTTMAFAFNRLHNSARSRDGELCLDLQKVRAEIEAHFKDTGVTL